MGTNTPAKHDGSRGPDEAEHDADDIRAPHDAIREKLEWLQIPPVSGDECIRILVKDGFTVEFAWSTHMELKRRGTVVQVPLANIVEPRVLEAILIKAQIGPSRFVAHS